MNADSIKAENLAYWYLRLNGVFSLTNFIVHPDEGREQRTDVDIMGVRFPFRSELLYNHMNDDEPFVNELSRPWFIICEVKSQVCNLNGPWTRSGDRNMQRVLNAIGLLKPEEIETAAFNLYQTGNYKNPNYTISLLCIGKRVNQDLRRDKPEVEQITFDKILRFIYLRFKKYSEQKASHRTWDRTGHLLWNKYSNAESQESYVNEMINSIIP